MKRAVESSVRRKKITAARRRKACGRGRRFWNVGVEVYADGVVKAAVLWSRTAKVQPKDRYRATLGLEAYSLWYDTAEAAHGAVSEARAMNADDARRTLWDL